jgi:hypothetical protein
MEKDNHCDSNNVYKTITLNARSCLKIEQQIFALLPAMTEQEEEKFSCKPTINSKTFSHRATFFVCLFTQIIFNR